MKDSINTPNAPKAIGPYSQAIIHGEYIFCSGQLPLDPKTMKMVGKTAAEQTKQIMENLKAVVEADHGNLENTLKVTIFLKDLKDFDEVNKVYESYFPEKPPARSCVEVSRLPKDALVEIECTLSRFKF